jgi:hypothetical protein
MVFSDLFNLIEVHGGFDLGRSKYQVRDAEGGLVWTPDYIKTYGFNLDFDWERGGFLKEVTLEGGWDKRGIYSDNEGFTTVVPGAQTSVEGQLVLRPRSNFEWSFEGDWTRQTIDGSGEAYNAILQTASLSDHLEPLPRTRPRGDRREPVQLRFPRRYYFGRNIVQLAFQERAERVFTHRLLHHSGVPPAPDLTLPAGEAPGPNITPNDTRGWMGPLRPSAEDRMRIFAEQPSSSGPAPRHGVRDAPVTAPPDEAKPPCALHQRAKKYELIIAASGPDRLRLPAVG